MDFAHDHLVGPLVVRVPTRARAALSRALADVHRDEQGAARAVFGVQSWRVPVTSDARLAPWQAEFILRDIVGCSDFGRDEKLAWEYALLFKGVQMTLAFQKFGLRVYVDARVNEATAQEMASAMASILSSAMPLLEKTILAEIADDQVARGEVNVENHYGVLARQYKHFSDMSERSLLAADTAQPIREAMPGPNTGYIIRFPEVELREQARFESKAAVLAFFSLLEHLLLIAFLLDGHDATRGALAAFIGAGWNDKFKKIVDLRNRESKRHYDHLSALHDELRNPSAHGEVHSDGTDFLFILPGVGPVPGRLVMRGRRRRLYQWRGGEADDVSRQLGETEQWLRTGPLAGAVAYGEAGLPLFFGSVLRDELVAVRHDSDALQNAIGRLSMLVDQSANLDW